MIGKVIGTIVEEIAVRTGIPIGRIWLLFLICCATFCMAEFGFRRDDLLIAAGICVSGLVGLQTTLLGELKVIRRAQKSAT